MRRVHTVRRGILLRLAMAACLASSAGSSQSLFLPNPFPVIAQPGAGAYQLVVADVTGDGYPDAVIGEAGVGPGATVDLFVFPGTGGSTFGAPIVSNLAPGIPSSWAFVAPFAAIDADGDGLLDVVTIRNSGPISNFPQGFCVLLNQGGGVFAAGTVGPDIPQVLAPYSNFAFADLDGDGGVDALCAGQPTVTLPPHVLKVYSTSPTAPSAFLETFSQNLNYSVDCIAACDMNGDGLKDFVYQRFNQGAPAQIVVLPRVPGGGFGPEIVSYWPTQAGPTFGTWELLCRDVNADGYVDVVGFGPGGNYPNFVAAIVTILGNGTGALSPGNVFVTTITPGQLGSASPFGDGSLGDFDADGQPDLRVLSKIVRLAPAYGGANVTYLDNSLLPASQYIIASEHAADVDLDGDLDVVQWASDLSGGPNRLGVAINRTITSAGCAAPFLTTGVPAPGNPAYTLGLAGASAGTPAAVGLSLSLGFNPVGPCIVHLELSPGQLILPVGSNGILMTDALGQAQLTLSIPNVPALLGTDYFLQWIVATPSGPLNLLGINYALSDARRILIW
jgi:FG-GAP-like repeat